MVRAATPIARSPMTTRKRMRTMSDGIDYDGEVIT
jgi:hypothetical protein